MEKNRQNELIRYAIQYLLDADLSSECWTEEDIRFLEKVNEGAYRVEVIKPNK